MVVDKVKQIDEGMTRQIFESVYQARLRYATGPAKDIWSKYVEAFFKRETNEVQDLKEVLEECVNDSLRELCDALEETDPCAALELLFGECNDRLRDYIVPKASKTFSLARGAWLIGVFGNGQKSNRNDALIVFNKYVRWLATHLMELHITSAMFEDDAERALRNAEDQLEMNRLVEPETRMMWIAAEITREIGQWAGANAGTCRISESLNLRTATQINENVIRAMSALEDARSKGAGSMPEAFSDMLLRGVPDNILHDLTASHRSISPANIRDTFNSDMPKFFPFVKIGDKCRVLGRSTWLMQREDALFHLCMQASPQHSRGRVFEEVTTALLQKWGPNGIIWRSSVDLMSPKNSKKTDDVDVFGSADQTVFIGECKANRLSENNSSVTANFESIVLTKAASQLAVRTAHWNSGWRPSKVNDAFADGVTGFIVTFSSYGSLLWNVAELGDEIPSVEFGILPLYSLVLAVSTFKTPAQFRDYLAFRLDSMAKGVRNFDELEYVLGFHNELGSRLNDLQTDARVHLRQYELDDRGVRIDPRKYKENQDWKTVFLKELMEYTVPVSPPVC